MAKTKDTAEAFAKFVEIIRALRDPVSGCPWDREQTHQSIRDYLLEEAYEFFEALEAEDDRELCTELGDVLLQVALHAQIASDRKAFNIADVIAAISEKMVRRHPHVFGDKSVLDSKEVVKNWEQIKVEERTQRSQDELREKIKQTSNSTLSSVPQALPALIQAQRLGEKASTAHFDWKNKTDVWSKVCEELTEVEAELAKQSSGNFHLAAMESEVGDLLFALCQFSRHLGFSAEGALRNACLRFKERFVELELSVNRPLDSLSDRQLEDAWQEAKKRVAEKKNHVKSVTSPK